MRAVVLDAAGDVRLDERDDPAIVEPTDAIVRLSSGCVCGSDLWPYRGFDTAPEPTAIGHEYCGTVEAVGNEVRTVRPGQFVVGSFFTSDNTCAIDLIDGLGAHSVVEAVGTQESMMQAELPDRRRTTGVHERRLPDSRFPRSREGHRILGLDSGSP